MENCLITKLKNIVSNDSLVKLGATKFTVEKIAEPTDSQRKMQIKVIGSEPVTVTAKGSGYFSTTVAGLVDNKLYSKDINSTDNTVSLYFANDDFEVEITNKKNIETLNLGSMLKMNITDLRYASSLTSFSATNTTIGNIEAFKDIPNLSIVNVDGAKDVCGDVKDLESSVYLDLCYFGNTNITGDIASIGKLPRLRAFILSKTKIYGNFEDFVSNQVIAGTSGNFGVNLGKALPMIKFGGVTHPYTDSVNSYVFWENNGQKIFVVYGTSNNYNVSNTMKIYCKGYTVEEIASKWPGYTVVRVDE